MKEQLKNCPNCGGTLDDTGRCMYCNSKVYDLTDINIDFDTRDILLMKIKSNGQETLMSCYPVRAEIEYESYASNYVDWNGRYCPVMPKNEATIQLELRAI